MKDTLFSHTCSVILSTLHVRVPSTLMYFGSRMDHFGDASQEKRL